MRSLLVLMLVATSASADVPARARALAAEGRKAHAAHDYARAVEAFEGAYALSPTSALIFNLAQAYRLAGNCESAAIMYRRFLESGPSVQAAQVAGVHMRAMERCTIPKPDMIVPVKVDLPPPTLASTSGSVRKKRVVMKSDHKVLATALAIGGTIAIGAGIVYALDENRNAAVGLGAAGLLSVGGAIGVHAYDEHVISYGWKF